MPKHALSQPSYGSSTTIEGIVRESAARIELAVVPAATDYNNFANYIRSYPDELPRLSNFQMLGQANDELNCHCYAVRMTSGYSGPAESLSVQMNAQEAHAAIEEWFQRAGYSPISLSPEAEPYKRDIRNEKVVVFGMTQDQAIKILGGRQRISEELKSTLASAMKFGNGVVYPTHSIKQNIKGNWESKMGTGPVIEVADPRDFGGGVYGEPSFAFTKKRQN
ncbi:DUF7689 domain-containing protein [Burkholderia sp. AW33-5]